MDVAQTYRYACLDEAVDEEFQELGVAGDQSGVHGHAIYLMMCRDGLFSFMWCDENNDVQFTLGSFKWVGNYPVFQWD